MNLNITTATASRVLRQLRHDRRTIAMLLIVPIALLTLVRYIINDTDATFDRFALPLLGIFPLLLMFLVTSIAMLRERTSGTLERLLTMPLAKLDLLAGYALAFGVVAVVQASLLVAIGVGVLGLNVAGPLWAVVVLAVANALLGMALGLLVSAFASSEFQAVQFMPAFLMPQLLLCGLVVNRDAMARPSAWVARMLPMTYAYDGLDELRRSSGFAMSAVADLAVIVIGSVAALAVGAGTLRRRTA